jgi:hypothetical protein
LRLGSYDGRDIYFQGIGASGFVTGSIKIAAPPESGGPALRYAAFMQGLRDAIDARIDANGFRHMPCGVRTACCHLADHIVAIERWRNALPASEQRQNHPQVIIRNCRRASAPHRSRRDVVRQPAAHRARKQFRTACGSRI